MRELRSDVVSNRRVRLLANQEGRYTITIEVIGLHGAWEDISMMADRDLDLHRQSVLPPTPDGARGTRDRVGRRMRDPSEDTLRDAAHDAFMIFWRSKECEQVAMWAPYCAAQVRYEAYLMRAR